jgi:segregation and condensation protein A
MEENGSITVSLDNFEGPLDFLLYLVQKQEIDVLEVLLSRITSQYLTHVGKEKSEIDLDQGAEFLGDATTLLLWKSRHLLPKETKVATDEEEEVEGPKFAILEHLVDYCRFRDAAKSLSHLEHEQTNCFSRGVDEAVRDVPQPSGMEFLTLDDLSALFQESLKRAAGRKGGTIEEEEYRVIDKIRELQKELVNKKRIGLLVIFSPEKSKHELIVYFLAILELMKMGNLWLVKEEGEMIAMLPKEANG